MIAFFLLELLNKIRNVSLRIGFNKAQNNTENSNINPQWFLITSDFIHNSLNAFTVVNEKSLRNEASSFDLKFLFLLCWIIFMKLLLMHSQKNYTKYRFEKLPFYAVRYVIVLIANKSCVQSFFCFFLNIKMS